MTEPALQQSEQWRCNTRVTGRRTPPATKVLRDSLSSSVFGAFLFLMEDSKREKTNPAVMNRKRASSRTPRETMRGATRVVTMRPHKAVHLADHNPSVPAKTVPEFIAYAKANPGKINMGSSGSGTLSSALGRLHYRKLGRLGTLE